MSRSVLTEWAIFEALAIDVDSKCHTFSTGTSHDSELGVDTRVTRGRHYREILSADWVVLDDWRIGSEGHRGCAEREGDGELHREAWRVGLVNVSEGSEFVEDCWGYRGGRDRKIQSWA